MSDTKAMMNTRPGLKSFKEHCYRCKTYFFTKKCGNTACEICEPLRIQRVRVSLVPRCLVRLKLQIGWSGKGFHIPRCLWEMACCQRSMWLQASWCSSSTCVQLHFSSFPVSIWRIVKNASTVECKTGINVSIVHNGIKKHSRIIKWLSWIYTWNVRVLRSSIVHTELLSILLNITNLHRI